jgi:soluble lytic murein transglycosylase-like protein
MKTFVVSVGLAICMAAPAAASKQLKGSDFKIASGKIFITNDETAIRVSQHDKGAQKELLKVRASKVRNNPATVWARTGSEPRTLVPRNAKVDSRVPAHLAPIIEEASRRHGIDPRLLAAVCRRESRFRANAVSPVGAQGVMQLMPATAKWLGVTDSFDPRQNIFGGAKYLKMLLNQFDGDLRLSLAAYNAGPGAVRKHRGIPPYRETQQYVAAIHRDYQSSLR